MNTQSIIKHHKEIEAFNWYTNLKYRLKTIYKVLTEKRFIYIGVDKTARNLDVHLYKLNNKGASKVLGSLKEIYDDRVLFGESVDKTVNEILNGNA